MKYQELYDEYNTYLDQYSKGKFELSTLPKGKIMKKRISGKEYNYLQFTSYGTRKTKYIKENEIIHINNKLSRRKILLDEINSILKELTRLEQAVKILDHKMSRIFMYLRQCADMDSLPLSKRVEAIAFSNAITALEGLGTSEETENGLKAWAEGKVTFSEFYLPILKMYRILEVDNG